MNSDIRVALTCPDHPKVRKLMVFLGDGAFWNLVKFWCFVAANKPDGDLSNYDTDDIEIGAGWSGKRGKFISTLTKLRFVDKTKDGLFIHDWEEHNGWASGAAKRSEKARKAAKARWEKKLDMPDDANSNATSITKHSDSHDFSNAPIPNPSPTPNRGQSEHKDTGQWARRFKEVEGGYIELGTGEFAAEITPFDEVVTDV